MGEPPTLDPYDRRATDLTYALARPRYPSLYRLLPDGEAEPYLASTAEFSRRGAIVRLRQDAVWSDGSPITSRDVVASVRRARAPSGFAGVRARRVDRHKVAFRGARLSPQSLGTAAFVLPGGKAVRSVSGGPFGVDRFRPGLDLRFVRNDAWWGDASALRAASVLFVEDLETLLALARAERLDVIAPLMSVNLDDRLRAAGLHFDEALGWETVYLTAGGPGTSPELQRAIRAAVDKKKLAEAFVRDDGRVTSSLFAGPERRRKDVVTTPTPPQHTSSRLTLAAPDGDELLLLLQEALQLQLQRAGLTVELVTTDAATFYGHWSTHPVTTVSLVRRSGSPSLERSGRTPGAEVIPLLLTETLIAWTDEINGPDANPTLEGPLWNLEAWTKTPV